MPHGFSNTDQAKNKKGTNRQMTNVQIWTWPLNLNPVKRQKLYKTLSHDEKKRADKYIYEKDRNRFIVARGTTRILLAEQVGTSPYDMKFVYGTNGKPSLPPPSPLFFNFSHSQNLACLAVCRDLDLGVDIERVRSIERHEVEIFFSLAEQKALSSMSDEVWLSSFYRCWTSKEAFVKALGDGLSYPLDKFDVSVEADLPAQLLRINGKSELSKPWTIIDFTPKSGFFGALSLATEPENVSLQITHL